MHIKRLPFFSLMGALGLLIISVQSADAIVADHTVISQFSSIPKSAIISAASKKVIFYHQSTGNNIVYMGLNCLSGTELDSNLSPECSIYRNARATGGWPYYDWSNWSWPGWPEPMANAKDKMDQFINLVNQNQTNYDYIGMKFCYVDGWNLDSNYYIMNMETLERTYPSKTFLWATSVLNAMNNVNNPTIQAFNDEVRSYAKAHNKPLYDMADIESKGGTCRINGYEVLCQEYWDSWGGDQGGHPDRDGSLVLAKGFWWLIANLAAGGSISQTPSPTPSLTTTPTPVAKLGDANGDGRVDLLDYVIWLGHYSQTSANGARDGDFNNNTRVDLLDYIIWLNNFGT